MRFFSVLALTAVGLAGCATPQAPVLSPALARYLTEDEKADFAEKQAEIRAVLTGKCSEEDTNVIMVYLPYAAINLAAAEDEDLRKRFEGDTQLRNEALAARDARQTIAETCDKALREASWGIL